MAVIYLRLSKRHNELGRNEIILTFRQGSTIYQRSGTEIFILNHKVQAPNAIGSMTGHAEGSKAFARYRKVELELKKSLTDMLD